MPIGLASPSTDSTSLPASRVTTNSPPITGTPEKVWPRRTAVPPAGVAWCSSRLRPDPRRPSVLGVRGQEGAGHRRRRGIRSEAGVDRLPGLGADEADLAGLLLAVEGHPLTELVGCAGGCLRDTAEQCCREHGDDGSRHRPHALMVARSVIGLSPRWACCECSLHTRGPASPSTPGRSTSSRPFLGRCRPRGRRLVSMSPCPGPLSATSPGSRTTCCRGSCAPGCAHRRATGRRSRWPTSTRWPGCSSTCRSRTSTAPSTTACPRRWPGTRGRGCGSRCGSRAATSTASWSSG